MKMPDVRTTTLIKIFPGVWKGSIAVFGEGNSMSWLLYAPNTYGIRLFYLQDANVGSRSWENALALMRHEDMEEAIRTLELVMFPHTWDETFDESGQDSSVYALGGV